MINELKSLDVEKKDKEMTKERYHSSFKKLFKKNFTKAK